MRAECYWIYTNWNVSSSWSYTESMRVQVVEIHAIWGWNGFPYRLHLAVPLVCAFFNQSPDQIATRNQIQTPSLNKNHSNFPCHQETIQIILVPRSSPSQQETIQTLPVIQKPFNLSLWARSSPSQQQTIQTLPVIKKPFKPSL